MARLTNVASIRILSHWAVTDALSSTEVDGRRTSEALVVCDSIASQARRVAGSAVGSIHKVVLSRAGLLTGVVVKQEEGWLANLTVVG